MKLAAFIAFSALLIPSAGALAGDPIEIPQNERVTMVGVDQVKVLRFDQPIRRIDIPKEGIVNGRPLSDTEIHLIGITGGQTPIIVYGEGGRQIYAGTIVVTPEAGHPVRIYRPPPASEKAAAQNTDGKVDAADEYWCSPVRCGEVIRRK